MKLIQIKIFVGIIFLFFLSIPSIYAEIGIIDESSISHEQINCIDYSTAKDKRSSVLINPNTVDEEIKKLGDSGIYCLRVFSTEGTLPFILESVKKYNESTIDQDITLHPVLMPLHNASKLKDDQSVLLIQDHREIIGSVVVGNGALDEIIVLEDGTSENLFTVEEIN